MDVDDDRMTGRGTGSRPASVVTVAAGYGIAAVCLLGITFDAPRASSAGPVTATDVIAGVVAAAAWVTLTRLARSGSRWARIGLTVFACLEIVAAVRTIQQAGSLTLVSSLLVLLSGAVLVSLHRPGARRRTAADDAQPVAADPD